ncbi:MAG: 30S ribosomal protein S8 [Deltaproteobacteria bacterium]|nr:30S ribosomal protein S8 [Deltaproteobacteria bacterium]
MSMSDPIADMITRIRNAGRANKKSVRIPGSRFKIALAKLLQEEGYIENYKFEKDNKQGILSVYLKYKKDDEKKHCIEDIQRVSRPGRRSYVKGNDIKPVLNGLGISVLSTSDGLMTDKTADSKNVGGEIVCNVW